LDPNLKTNSKQATKAGQDYRQKVLKSRVSQQPKTSKHIRYVSAELKHKFGLNTIHNVRILILKQNTSAHQKHLLEIDHIQPIYAGGEMVQNNLRLLCRGHNQIRKY